MAKKKPARPVSLLPSAGGRLGDMAEGIGSALGHVLSQIEGQVRSASDQRQATIKNLVAIRDRANRLLADLGHAVMEVPLPRIGKRRSRPAKTQGSAIPPAVAATGDGVKKKRTMSPASRERIGTAQRKHWAAQKKNA